MIFVFPGAANLTLIEGLSLGSTSCLNATLQILSAIKNEFPFPVLADVAMSKSVIGVLWGLVFVVIESIQFVYFGGLFQRMSSFEFGFLVFGIASAAFIAL